MSVSGISQTPVPWWVRSKAPWSGEIFGRMILGPDDPEERRIQAIRASILARYIDGKRRLSAAKALIITRSYQETEGVHPAIRRALAIARVFAEIHVELVPDQLLMGTASSGPHVVDFSPEFMHVVPEDPTRAIGPALPLEGAEKSYVVNPEDVEVFANQIFPYWRDRCRGRYGVEELRRHHPDAWFYCQSADVAMPPVGGPLVHTVQDYASVIAKGLNWIKAEIRERIARLDAANPKGNMGEFERRNIYEAMLICADAMIHYAHRNADLAERLAVEEPNAERAAELREMARICRKVPADPAETWWEALQSFHFLRLGTSLAEDGDSHSAGRFDQYMYRYLRADLDSRRLTKARAQELLECFFLKWNETHNFKLDEDTMGVGNNDKITIGGMTEYGHDCTNELSYMLLEAHAHVHLNDPNLSMRVHKNTPNEFLLQALEVVRLGGGLPILINDEVIVPALVSRCGVTLEDARNYADLGCQENVTDPNITGADANGRTNAGWFSLPKPVELALFNGTNPRNGLQVGPRTGDPRTFATMEQFVAAVKEQTDYAVELNVIANNANDYVFARYFPCVFHDLMHSGPRASGVDINGGGCRYNWTGAIGVGMANAGDILASVDHLIFRQREIGWEDLLSALERNWEGAEDLRRKCIAAPKYGCDDEYADGWARKILEIWFDAYERHSTSRGGRFVCGLISVGTYVTLGRKVGPTPDGRRRGERLAEATNGSQYAPAAGPTATHRSATRAIDTYRTPNGITFNQRFNATSVATRRDLSKWADLVRGYFDAGGQQVQYNVVDGRTLERAQRHPEEYRDLVVRVGGYSAVFVDLSKDVQASIISRAEQTI